MIEGLKPYAEYRESGVPWLGMIPSRWSVQRSKLLLQEFDVRTTTGKEQLLRVSQYTGVTERKARDDSGAADTRAATLVGYKRVRTHDLVQELRTVSACSLLNKGGHGLVGNVAFEAVPTFDLPAPALEFEFHERTQATEEVVADGLLAAHEEALGVADLLDRPMIALDGPVFPVRLLEGGPGDFHALFFRGSKAA